MSATAVSDDGTEEAVAVFNYDRERAATAHLAAKDGDCVVSVPPEDVRFVVFKNGKQSKGGKENSPCIAAR